MKTRAFVKSEEITFNNITEVISDIRFLTESLLQTEGVEFERCVCLWGSKGLMKDTIEFHYWKCSIYCFWSMTHISQDILACSASVLTFFKNLSYKFQTFIIIIKTFYSSVSLLKLFNPNLTDITLQLWSKCLKPPVPCSHYFLSTCGQQNGKCFSN